MHLPIPKDKDCTFHYIVMHLKKKANMLSIFNFSPVLPIGSYRFTIEYIHTFDINDGSRLISSAGTYMRNENNKIHTNTTVRGNSA